MTDSVSVLKGLSGEQLLNRAIAVWRKAQVVHESPAWEGQPEARAIVEALAQHPEVEHAVYELLADPSQLVVAYSLLTLELMGSGKLADLPEHLLANRSNITLVLGSFKSGMDLGGLARQLQKRAKARACAQIRPAMGA